MSTGETNRTKPIDVRGILLPERETRQEYRQNLAGILLNSVDRFVALLDADGILLEVNQFALDLAGVAFSDVEGKPFWATAWWQESEAIQAPLRDSIGRAARGEVVRWETAMLGGAGGTEPIEVEASLRPLKNEDGAVVFITAEGRELTEKKAYEQKIARQREELAQLKEWKSQFSSIGRDGFRAGPTVTTSAAAAAPAADRGLASPIALAGSHKTGTSDNERVADLLERPADGCIALDAEWRLTYMNAEAERINGLKQDDVFGKTLWEIFPGAAGTEIERELRRAVSEGIAVSFENHYEPLDRWFEVHAYSPAAGGLTIFFRDVTERTRAEEIVHKSEQRFRALVAASSDIVYQMNPDWTEMWHLVGRQSIADTPEPIANWVEKYIPATDHRLVRDAVDEAIRTKEMFALEHPIVRVDGSLGWIASRAIPVLDGNGEIVEWFGAASDVTRRRQGEAERERLSAESERQQRIYEAALSNTPDLVYVFDLDHRFIYANEALLGMWGRTREEAVGKNCLELGYEPWHAAMHDREIDQVAASRQPIRGEVPFVGTNGRRIYDYIFVPVIDPGGAVVAVAGSTRDVTERRNAEVEIQKQSQRLRENSRRKDEFLAMLAHELRNPLAAISNAVQLAKRSGAAEHREWSQGVIEVQVKNLARMIDDLLDVSRITRGKIELRKQSLSVGRLVDSALETVRPFLEERKHRLLVDLTPNLHVTGDPTRLEQVLVNLLSNAAKYTDSGGRITLSTREEGTQAVITVEDTGIGMNAELLDRAFDLFAQGDRTIARSEGGLGIGLTLVKSLVEMHGGSVSATSDGLGRGSRFTVRIPVVPDPSADRGRREMPSDGEKLLRLRILVVDDNADTAMGMARLLDLLGHDVRIAHDGLAAIREARVHRPDIVLLDLGLPGMDGYQVSRTLRDEGFAQTVIIAVSGYGEAQAHTRSRESGFNHHLVKPVDFDSLVALIGGPR